MVEAFFNHLAGDQAHALSAGTHPADRVGPAVVAAMREMGAFPRRRP
jgi:protein-tyrosine-phosphatase